MAPERRLRKTEPKLFYIWYQLENWEWLWCTRPFLLIEHIEFIKPGFLAVYLGLTKFTLSGVIYCTYKICFPTCSFNNAHWDDEAWSPYITHQAYKSSSPYGAHSAYKAYTRPTKVFLPTVHTQPIKLVFLWNISGLWDLLSLWCISRLVYPRRLYQSFCTNVDFPP